MHRITNLRATQVELYEWGKALFAKVSSVKFAKRSEDESAKSVVPKHQAAELGCHLIIIGMTLSKT